MRDFIYGKLHSETSAPAILYTGITTDSAITNVDNSNMAISVDVRISTEEASQRLTNSLTFASVRDIENLF